MSFEDFIFLFIFFQTMLHLMNQLCILWFMLYYILLFLLIAYCAVWFHIVPNGIASYNYILCNIILYCFWWNNISSFDLMLHSDIHIPSLILSYNKSCEIIMHLMSFYFVIWLHSAKYCCIVWFHITQRDFILHPVK